MQRRYLELGVVGSVQGLGTCSRRVYSGRRRITTVRGELRLLYEAAGIPHGCSNNYLYPLVGRATRNRFRMYASVYMTTSTRLTGSRFRDYMDYSAYALTREFHIRKSSPYKNVGNGARIRN